jgi:undecaprenyl diphosphate synthase
MDTLWPDFDGEDLRRAVEAFRRRERRYGGLPTDTAIRAAS